MIRKLNVLDEEDIIKLNNCFKDVLNDVKKDLDNNPFSHYIIYLDNDKLLGYINYYLIYNRIEIANFNVLDDYQNKGIGTKLLIYLISNNRNIDNITLEVKKDNEKAIYLYHKYGFIDKAIRKGYYDGVDGILMELEMKK